MKPDDIILAAPVRTPIGRFGGSLAEVPAPDLGGIALAESLKRAGVAPADVSEVIFGNARSAGVGPNPARQVAFKAGLPQEVPAWTVNQACGSGMRTIISGVQAVTLGDSRIVAAGGTESMSRVPYMLDAARWGKKMGHQPLIDGMYRDGFLCPLCGLIMGNTAENLADRYEISREEQDEYAAESQARAQAARNAQRFADEIVPVPVPGKRGGETLVSRDEHPRDGITAQGLSRLPPIFRKNGTVHAGNSSGITDGAAAVLIMSAATARELGVRPAARVVAYETAGVDPTVMGIGPVPAVRRLLARTGLTMADMDLVELNEAFAVQALACHRELGFDRERLNVNGGAIALGHPIGATGTRIVVTLLHEMARRGARRGLATLCVSGGMGLALLLEACREE
ncbi:MAG: acetyl-CoA C-acetyltransferase [Acidobacteria bacterium]|nr:MAG: acetyl-CoA C-acetyltransferase [Acidobacteriota bacterium]TDI39904.1 MAG: acetyl-CoA C-acetyltransferase [Acidobacteriota bacterium]